MQNQPGRLSGKVAIVTGAGATGSGDFVGIGQAISILFARNGASVLLVDRDQPNAETTLATIREEGGEASVFLGDVTSNDDCQEMAKAAVDRYGHLDILINNVGISGPGSVTDVDEDLWDTVLDVNLKSVMLTSKHSIPRMIEAGGGSIVNLSSIVGLRAGSGRPSHPYAASKGGIIGLSNSMAVHYGRDNVRVNCNRSRSRPQPYGSPPHFRGNADFAPARPAPLVLTARPGTWLSPPCSWLPTRPAGCPGLPCRWTAGLLAATPLAMFPHLTGEE